MVGPSTVLNLFSPNPITKFTWHLAASSSSFRFAIDTAFHRPELLMCDLQGINPALLSPDH
jgi:hypothetical protein